MEQHPANYPQPLPPQMIPEPMSHDDPNKMQYNPQSSPPPLYTGPPAGTHMCYSQGQLMQTYPPPPQQQQQESVAVIGAPTPMIIQETRPPTNNYNGFACIGLAVIVFMFCNPVFGFIAFGLAGEFIHATSPFLHVMRRWESL